MRLSPANGSPLYSDIAKVSLPGYESAKAKADSGAYEPETPQTNGSANGHFSRSDRITPELVGATLLQVLAERRETSGSTEFAVAEASANPRSQRPARRGSAPSDNETGGESNVTDEPDDASNRPVRHSLRQVPHTVEEVGSEDEE